MWKKIKKKETLLAKTSAFLKWGVGEEFAFWEDKWCGEVPLCVLYPSVYIAAASKQENVAEIWDHSDVMGGWNPRFLRSFNDWELEIVYNFSL